ncbi:hypothetical protein LY78DRAFT_651193 [Colletotrichum sublineola]|nr:hypothetical protein LY78DRAFT_651193 [Colletotrichum sublineola]
MAALISGPTYQKTSSRHVCALVERVPLHPHFKLDLPSRKDDIMAILRVPTTSNTPSPANNADYKSNAASNKNAKVLYTQPYGL